MEVLQKGNDFSIANIYNCASDISNNLYHHRGNIVIDASFNVNGPVLIDGNCTIGEYCDIGHCNATCIRDISLNELSQKLKIHIERLSVVSIHKNEEVKLKPDEFIIDLTKNTYEKILKPDKIYQHCAIIQDSIQDNIIEHNKSLSKNIYDKTDNIFIFDDIITNEQCDHIIETMESYFKKKDFGIEKWEIMTNVNCIYHLAIKELEDIVYKIINILIKKLNNYNIKCTGDSGYCYRKIYGPTRLHSDTCCITDNEYIAKNKIRNISVIVCLNEHYEGGEFYFPRQDRKIKLKKGNIMAFPPYWTHPHMTYPLLNNTYRYTINTWLYE
jgi:hypothetical protein